jgi:hypothetical protein
VQNRLSEERRGRPIRKYPFYSSSKARKFTFYVFLCVFFCFLDQNRDDVDWNFFWQFKTSFRVLPASRSGESQSFCSIPVGGGEEGGGALFCVMEFKKYY